MTESATARRLSRRAWVLLTLATFLLAGIATVTITSMAWGAGLRAEERLLPGTVIGTVPVGETTLAEAIAAVEAHLDPQLDRVIEVVHGEDSWAITARELGATTDAEQVVASAFDETLGAGVPVLAWMRWAGGTADLDLDVDIVLADQDVSAFLQAIADEVDRDPLDAALTWTSEGFELRQGRTGRTVDQTSAADGLAAAFDLGDATVELPVAVTEPAVTTELAQQVADGLTPRIDEALDRVVTAVLDGRSWTITPRELDAVPDVEPLVAAGFAPAAGPDDATPVGDDDTGIEVAVPDETLAAFVATIAAAVDEPARDAQFSWSGGKANITPERTGRALDRTTGRARLLDALQGGADRVQLSTVTVRPAVTSASFNRFLLVDQRARELHLVEGEKIIRTWPIAVGLAGSPTPTGVFTVGAKRFEPTWVNPSPNGWGKDMPARIGPGPSNPLGLRALNWNRNGRDTLIRFHGTPNEASIGEEASRGCVRMYNSDVIELFDLVSSGTTIVSIR